MADEQKLLELIAAGRQGVLAVVKSDGYPQMSNVLYIWDAAERVARISTTADRVKGRVLRRDPHAALHVSGGHFWAFAVAEGDADLTDPAAEPGDEALRELHTVHSHFSPDLAEETFAADMIEAQRLVIRLHVRRVYGIALENPPG
jgi:PPOX class probable F420-dependent enzyme